MPSIPNEQVKFNKLEPGVYVMISWKNKILLLNDITKAQEQIKIKPASSKATRFIWNLLVELQKNK